MYVPLVGYIIYLTRDKRLRRSPKQTDSLKHRSPTSLKTALAINDGDCII